MGLVTHSDKRNRVYQRAFDHDEALALHTADPERWTRLVLADRYGVTYTAVQRVLDPKRRKKMDEAAKRWMRNAREPCKGGCGRLVWTHGGGPRTGYCVRCIGAQIAAPNVRPDALRCTKCGEWKPDEAFYSRPGAITRRERGKYCRACETKARADRRARNREGERATANRIKRKGKAMAKFVVMRKRESEAYQPVAEVEAVSRMAAIEKVADRPGTYVAVTHGQLREFQVEEASAFKVVSGLVEARERNHAARAADAKVLEAL